MLSGRPTSLLTHPYRPELGRWYGDCCLLCAWARWCEPSPHTGRSWTGWHPGALGRPAKAVCMTSDTAWRFTCAGTAPEPTRTLLPGMGWDGADRDFTALLALSANKD